MADLLQYFDFTSDPLNILLIFDLVFLENFDSNLLPSEGMCRLFDLAEGALAK